MRTCMLFVPCRESVGICFHHMYVHVAALPPICAVTRVGEENGAPLFVMCGSAATMCLCADIACVVAYGMIQICYIFFQAAIM